MPTSVNSKPNYQNSQSSSLAHLRNILALLLGFYFLIGIALGFSGKRQEIFPIFSWFLFDKVPNTVTRYNIMIHQYQGKDFNPAITLSQGSSFIVGNQEIKARVLIQQLGKAHARGDKNEFSRLRNILETNFFKETTKYELILETYQPIQRWKTGEVKRQSIDFFTLGESD